MTKPSTPKKEVEYKLNSRRQMWQTYQHLLKTLDYAKAIRKQAHEKYTLPENVILFQLADELTAQTWIAMNKIKRLSVKLFDCYIQDLEVYK